MRLAAPYCVLSAMAALLSGCGAMDTYEAWKSMERSIPGPNSVLVHPAPVMAEGHEHQNYIKKFALMALFSKVVYRQDLDQLVRIGHGCKYLKEGEDWFGMPHDGKDRRWRRLTLALPAMDGKPAIDSCVDKEGLYFETYIHEPAPGQPADIAVIAIRGTENYSASERYFDWSANLAATMGKDPAAYRLARTTITPLIEHISANNPGIKIYVTGHSLGGGIAQQIAYTSPQVAAAYVFDSSPVTNWSQMKLMIPSPVLQDTPTIFRINHSNEFLQTPRLVATRLTTTRLHRSDYEFNFQNMQPVDSHEMGILACHFAVRIPETGADFDFPAAFVKEMIATPAICPRGERKVNLPLDPRGEIN